MTVDSAVLAGGRSQRMGSDKALVRVDGERLVDRALQRLGPLGGEVIVVRGGRQPIPGLDVPQIRDRVVDGGPLAGIEAALRHLATTLVAVVAVDLPDMSAAVLGALADRWDGEAPAVVPEVAGWLQPLHAVWSREALPEVTATLDDGERSPTSFASTNGAQVAGHDVWGQLDPVALFARNLNRPTDLER